MIEAKPICGRLAVARQYPSNAASRGQRDFEGRAFSYRAGVIDSAVMSGGNLAHDAESDAQSSGFGTGKEVKKSDKCVE